MMHKEIENLKRVIEIKSESMQMILDQKDIMAKEVDQRQREMINLESMKMAVPSML